MNRKELKRQGKRGLKGHYLIFVAACLIAAFLGSEFKGSLNFSLLRTYEQIVEDPSKNIQFIVSVPGQAVTWENVLMQIMQTDTQAGRGFPNS